MTKKVAKLLLDGDLFCYRNAAAAENDPVEHAQNNLELLLDYIVTELGASSFQFYLTGENNFRFNVYPEYKANRNNVPKPRHLAALREYLITKYGAIVSEGCEADDLMGIAQTHQTGAEPTIIVSLDKDMLQVPGWHYSWRIEGGPADKRWVKEAKLQEITPLQGYRNFYMQMLTGDSTDNIKGVRGVGKMKALAILREEMNEQEMFDAVRDAYSLDEEMLMNGDCLWIMRNENEPFSKTKKGMELVTSISEG